MIALLLLLILAACAPPPDPQNESRLFLTAWFAKAVTGERSDNLCHGLGVLKHPQFTCREILQYAALGDTSRRHMEHFRARDCFDKVCGTFYEAEYSGFDQAGNELNETVVLKQDEGRLQVYWYRNSAMMQKLVAEQPDKEEKAPEQVAYDALVALHPELYQFPPCYGARPSSTNLAGDLFLSQNADVPQIESWAKVCPQTFCFAVVGQKIAPLCPR